MMLINFSPNMLKTYQACPKKYWFKYVEGVNVPISSLPFEKGKKIHALANYYLQGVNVTRLESALNPHELDVWHTLLANPFFQKKCLKSEYQLSCKIGNFWVGGRLDAVVFEDGNYFILDYKTGSIPKSPEIDYQTMVYLLCLDKALAGMYDKLSFVYINLKDKNNYVIEFTPQLKAEYEKRIKEICNKIISDSLYNCNEQNCSRCEYLKLCDKCR